MGGELPAEPRSWEWGPASSRVVRTPLYVLEGLVGGVLLLFAKFFGEQLLDADRLLVGIVGVVFLVAVLLYWRFRDEYRAWQARARRKSRLRREWHAVRRLRWTAVATVPVGLGFVAGEVRYGVITGAGLVFTFLYVAVHGLAAFLTASGTIDLDEGVLTYARPGLQGGQERERVYDLDALTSIRRVPVGGRTLAVLAFADGSTGGVIRRLAWIPTGVVVETAPAFERALARDGELTEAARSEGAEINARTHALLPFGLVFFLFGLIAGVRSIVIVTGLFTLSVFGGYLVATDLGFV